MSIKKCEYCHTTFKNQTYLEHHQKNSQKCLRYKNMLFMCRNCMRIEYGIHNIEKHIKKCTCISTKEDEEKIKLWNDNLVCNAQVEQLESQLKIEKIKNSVYRDIIERNIQIKTSEIIHEEPDCIHIYNFKGDHVPICIHDDTKDNNLLKNKKFTYRSLKNVSIDRSVTENPKVDDDIISLKDNVFILEESCDIDKLIEKCFEKLVSSRMYTKILDDLKKYRLSISIKLNIEEYTKLIESHIEKITEILKEKNYDDKKIVSIISKGLTALESRILGYGKYTQTFIDIEEVERFNIILSTSVYKEKEYVVFDMTIFCNKFYNYSIVLYSFSKNLMRYLININGYNNIIFLPLAKNTSKDPFSFYILEKISKDKKYWKMDCRLEYLTIQITTRILPYMITMFRRIYKSVYNDNEFRNNYINNYQITEYDCEQLLKNIYLLAQPSEFSILLRNIVKKYALYNPPDNNENDKFNLYGDDSLQRKRFQGKQETNLLEVTKQIFDDISNEDAVDFYRTRTA